MKQIFIKFTDLRNKSRKPECVLSFNMGWRILVFIFMFVAHNSCCQIRADYNSSTCTFMTGKSVTCTGTCANEIILN